MKVGYLIAGGHTSTAYLEDVPLEDGSYVGVNKHSDMPVHLRWDDEQEVWVEVCHREWRAINVYTDEWEEIDPQPCVCRERSA